MAATTELHITRIQRKQHIRRARGLQSHIASLVTNGYISELRNSNLATCVSLLFMYNCLRIIRAGKKYFF